MTYARKSSTKPMTPPTTMMTDAWKLVATCVAEAGDPDYREAVRFVVPKIHRTLVEAGYPGEAEVQLEAALLALQPVVERQPENIALAELYGVLAELHD